MSAAHSDAAAGRFFRDEPVEIAVLLVTYNSADDIGLVLADLRLEARDCCLRVIVADNGSSDTTVAEARAHDDVVVVETGGNLGYAGGVNAAMTRAGATESVLVLNPDLRLERGVLSVMLRRLRSSDSIGAVVPRIHHADGSVSVSVRREPSILRAFADAIFGRVWRGRPALLTEHVRRADAYVSPHPVDWATGAVLLIRAAAAREVGGWDERFFLYSEETDYQRRLRDAGWSIWFEPAASVTHRGGGSGASDDLEALLVVNRVRYMQKHAPRRAAAFRAAVMLGEQVRHRPGRRRARWALRRRSRWRYLPHARWANPRIDHVLVTRFNLPTGGLERLVRSRDGWLRDRIELFERYTVPSVARQTERGFSWIVYLDPESPSWLLDRLEPYARQGLFLPLYREAVTWRDVSDDARAVTGARGTTLLTTNLDNDDALAEDFVARVQAVAKRHAHAVIYLSAGLIARGDELFRRRDDANAFCSVAEGWADPQTAWRDGHPWLHRHFPVVVEHGDPAWLQVVHDHNVSNRVRGRRVAPAAYRPLFGALLRDTPAPGLLPVAADRVVRGPLRGTREVVRAAGKRVVLGIGGKEGLDRLRELIATG